MALIFTYLKRGAAILALFGVAYLAVLRVSTTFRDGDGDDLQNTGVVARKEDSSKETTKDGAFFREEDIATENEDWANKECAVRSLDNQEEFYEYIFTRRLQCNLLVMLGGSMPFQKPVLDGEKWMCASKKMNVKPRNCLVYSFGIGKDWTFDDEIARKYSCEVFSFDPTIGEQDHNRSANIRFFNLGISDVNKTSPGTKIKVDRYVNILTKLGHLDSVIDFLKIDVEGSELKFFKDVFKNTPNLLKKVKMLSMEVHISASKPGIVSAHRAFWRYFQLLDCFGFKIVYSAVNPVVGSAIVAGRPRACCYEIVWARDRQW